MTFFHFFFQPLHLTVQITFRAAGVAESGQIIYFRQVAEKLRGQKGLSQKEPAGMIGVNPAQYGRVENNKVEPTLRTMLKIAAALEVTLGDLVKGKDNPMKEIEVKDKSLISKVQMIDQLPDDEKDAVLKVSDMALTKMKMRDFFRQLARLNQSGGRNQIGFSTCNIIFTWP